MISVWERSSLSRLHARSQNIHNSKVLAAGLAPLISLPSKFCFTDDSDREDTGGVAGKDFVPHELFS